MKVRLIYTEGGIQLEDRKYCISLQIYSRTLGHWVTLLTFFKPKKPRPVLRRRPRRIKVTYP